VATVMTAAGISSCNADVIVDKLRLQQETALCVMHFFTFEE